MNLYWGDLHNHCGITYGYGSLDNALSAARGQLDFCAIIGHAMWPDIPERTEKRAFMVDYHLAGFAKLRENWERVRETIEQANVPHEFVTLQGYEIHSREFGDHHILSPDKDLPIVEANSPAELVAKVAPRRVIAVPHHIGYTPGYRGANWEAFSPEISPIIEVYSKHGSSMSDESAYPYYHTMGPRDSRSTVRAGMRKGYRFGFVGSTDHHAGYPGSYGDGRLAVLAKEKTREAIWEALLDRRTYAVTGDKIACLFRVNGHDLGSEIQAAGDRKLTLDVTACDTIDKIVIYKNAKPWRVVNGETITSDAMPERFKIRIETGWGKAVDGFAWEGHVSVKDGTIASVETCFRGRSVLSPSQDQQDSGSINALGNVLKEQTPASVAWTCTSFKNPSTLQPATQAIILEIEGDEQTVLNVQANGKSIQVSVGELLQGSRSAHLDSYVSEAILVHRAVPETQYRFTSEWTDTEKEQSCDVYDVEIRQKNNQYAWISPIFVCGV